MIRERTSAGLAVARAEGRVGGRRPKLTPAQRAVTDGARTGSASLVTVENVASGRRTAAQMAQLHGVSEATVSGILAAARAPGIAQ